MTTVIIVCLFMFVPIGVAAGFTALFRLATRTPHLQQARRGVGPTALHSSTPLCADRFPASRTIGRGHNARRFDGQAS